MTQHDPISGPMPREEFQKLVDAPYGAALTEIRKYDPLYGRKPGEKIKWRVTLEREIAEVGTAYIEAETKEDAEKLADKLTEAQIDWEAECSWSTDLDGTIKEIVPAKSKEGDP